MSKKCTICEKPLMPINDSLPDDIKQLLNNTDRCTACLVKFLIEASKPEMEMWEFRCEQKKC